MSRPYCVALTGGIGSGKSRVADCFTRLGVEVIDTDIIARELTASDGPVLDRIREIFGTGVMRDDGSLDRAALRARVFADPAQRKQLESILHPLIRERVARRLHASNADYVLLVVPLLVESGAYWELVDRVLLVDCAPAEQIQRVTSRDGVSREIAEAMLAAQASPYDRRARADDVIDNNGDGSNIEGEVARLHRRYLQAATTGLPLQ